MDGEPKNDGPWKMYLRLQIIVRFWICTVFVKFQGSTNMIMEKLPCEDAFPIQNFHVQYLKKTG